jgi:hypothetical protein
VNPCATCGHMAIEHGPTLGCLHTREDFSPATGRSLGRYACACAAFQQGAPQAPG